MALVERLFNLTTTPQPQASAWTTPAWWDSGTDTTAGVAVGPDTALKISTVFACVGLLSETIASLPLVIYRYMENEQGRERARNHPLYEVLRSQPNATQTAFDFIQMMQAHALLRGSGYAHIKPGPRGFADQLVPLHPDNVTKERLASGRLRYRVRGDDGREQVLSQEEMFEVGGLTLDGWQTVSVVQYARDAFGLSMAAERYGSRFFRNDSRPGGVLRTEGRLSKDAASRLKTSWESAHSGGNQNRVAILEDGLQWQSIGIPPDQAQFLQTREFQAEDVCRWFRVPPHMVGLTSKQTSWGTGIEEQTIGFLTYTLRPWLTRWTQAISRDLIIAPQTYFADFVVEHLLRGDIASRYNAYSVGRQWGWLSVNEIRRYENLNPVEGGDIYLQPMNMSQAGAPAQAAAFSHYRQLAEEAAGRVVRKEIAAMGKAAQRWSDPDEFTEAAALFYGEHAAYVAQTMRISLAAATAYCEVNRSALVEYGPEVMADWQPRRVNDLADLATGGDDDI